MTGSTHVSLLFQIDTSMRKKRKYDVRKIKVVKGPNFLEDYYKPFPENIVGLWVKYGQGASIENPNLKKLLCCSCLEASERYRDKEMILQMKRSYQVENFTNGEYYDWDRIGCGNPNCWGPKERCFKVSKKSTNTVHGEQFMFSQFKVQENQTEERVSHFYVNLQLKDRSKWTYEAIGYQSKMKPFFFPNLVDSCHRDSGCFYFVSLHQYQRTNPNYKYPVVWKFEHFRENKEIRKFPDSVADLDSDHFPLARSFLGTTLYLCI